MRIGGSGHLQFGHLKNIEDLRMLYMHRRFYTTLMTRYLLNTGKMEKKGV